MKILITGGSGFIGTNLIDYLLSKGFDNIVNVDIKEPVKKDHYSYWVKCNIQDIEKLDNIFQEKDPKYVVHLAARADVDGTSIDDYDDNTIGTKNLVEVINSHNVKRSVITSTQFVYQDKDKPEPAGDLDFKPHTVYGESKVITEKHARNIESTWTIIRPTNIWGEWHWRYPYEFWKVLYQRRYLHPNKNVIRSYGYVGTVAEQIFKILTISEELIKGEVFYVGNKPIHLVQWVDTFSKALVGKPAIKVPKQVLYLIGLFGSALKTVGITIPLTLSRYRSMTTDNPAPMEKTFRVLGETEFSLNESVDRTVDWLYDYHEDIYSKSKL